MPDLDWMRKGNEVAYAPTQATSTLIKKIITQGEL